MEKILRRHSFRESQTSATLGDNEDLDVPDRACECDVIEECEESGFTAENGEIVQVAGFHRESSQRSWQAQSEEPTHRTNKHRQSEHNVNPPYAWSWFDNCVYVLAILSYAFDVGSDLFLVYVYYSDGHKWWFIFTLLLVFGPSVIIALFSITWYIQDVIYHDHKISPVKWMIRVLFTVLQLTPVCR